LQPEGVEYVKITVPAEIPVTTPVMPIAATDGLLLVHTPPAQGSLNVIVVPTHNVFGPVIGHGVHGTTLTLFVIILVHPVTGSMALTV
jgi:hypothetical protein